MALTGIQPSFGGEQAMVAYATVDAAGTVRPLDGSEATVKLVLPKKAHNPGDKTPWLLPIKIIPLIPIMVSASTSASALDNSSTFPNSAGLSGLFSTQVSVDTNKTGLGLID